MATAAPHLALRRNIGDCCTSSAIAAPHFAFQAQHWRLRRNFADCGATLPTAALALGIFAAMLLPPGAQVGKGIFLGATLVYPYGLAHFCFVIPRRAGLLRLLTPATPVQLVLAKYASAFSMALFTVNIPGLMLRDLDFLVGHPTLST
ncbi:MAG: hypothetical protein DMG13_31590, partial [Acidobacteria bacterium]